jgi:septum formation protein
VAAGSPLDKAGAYAIQDLEGALVDGVVGSYTNVVGLPVEATRRLLEGFGVVVSDRSGS